MSRDESTWRQKSTLVEGGNREQYADASVPGLTVLWHPDPDRVGDEAGLPGLLSNGSVNLSRSEPYFAPPGGGTPRPLAAAHLSRQPLRLTLLANGGVRLDPSVTRTSVAVDGRLLTEPRDIRRDELATGVVLLLGQRIVLFLQLFPSSRPRPPGFGLVGESPALLRLRQEIERLADLDYPVLLRGESGTGKELVARALHERGRRKGKCISVNIGAIPSALAVAELFGVVRGAYTGADRQRRGYFEQADGGTLFLDEIGEAPAEIQVLLLRALETGQIQPVGASSPVAVNVRLVSATDADLEAAIAVGEFRLPLYHRLSSCELELPPLRARRDDLGRLLLHFLRQELSAVGEERRLDPGAEFIARLARYSWPGNVRELRNVVRQLVVANRGETELSVPAKFRHLLDETPASDPRLPARRPIEAGDSEAEAPAYRQPEDVGETELLQAFREKNWNVGQTAAVLNVSRTSFYSLMRKYRVRTASDLSREEIEDVVQRCEGRIEAMVELLEVSKRGLQLRMTELGLVIGSAHRAGFPA